MTDSDQSLSDLSESEDDLAYGSLPRAPAEQPKSVLGKLKDRILDHGRQQRPNRQTGRHERSPPPPRRSAESDSRRRRADLPPEQPRPREQQRPASIYEDTPDTSPERFSDVPLPSRDSYVPHSERDVAAMQRAVEEERRQYLGAKHRFQQASQRSTIDPDHVQHLLNHVKLHGTLLATAQRRLQVAKEQQRQDEAARRTRSRPQQHRPSPPRQPVYESEDEDDGFNTWPPRPFGAFSGTSNRGSLFEEPVGHTGAFDPFAGFRMFDRLFADMDPSFHVHGDGFQFFAGQDRGPSFERTHYSNTGPSSSRPRHRPRTFHSTRSTNSTNSNTPPQPTPPQMPMPIPTNPLRAPEATRLFTTYNETWLRLPTASPTIPYPTRTLLAPALADPSTIPHPAAPAWSAEQTMQANTALFFVLAHGLVPEISDSGVVSFDRARADEGRVRALVAALKREKMRWHSDRLGRRNEGVGGDGVNEVLQRDERARAVFHGVCALMEGVEGRVV